MIASQNSRTNGCRALTLAAAYMTAKERVIQSGFAHEIDWQHNLALESITESSFLREAAWVILSAGMREQVIRDKFPAISIAFGNWATAADIVSHQNECRRRAIAVFANKRKIDSIIRIAEEVFEKGFRNVLDLLWQRGVDYLFGLPYMGPATSFHLAKNLGLPVVKPDRHLCRVAKMAGYCSPELMCKEIARIVGDKLAVIDLVIWRYANLDRRYLALFSIH